MTKPGKRKPKRTNQAKVQQNHRPDETKKQVNRRDALGKFRNGALLFAAVGALGWYIVSEVRAGIDEADLTKIGNGIPTQSSRSTTHNAPFAKPSKRKPEQPLMRSKMASCNISSPISARTKAEASPQNMAFSTSRFSCSTAKASERKPCPVPTPATPSSKPSADISSAKTAASRVV